MAKEKLEDLSLDRLRKRKKIAVVLMWVLIGVFILNAVVLFVGFVKEKPINVGFLGGAAPLPFFALYFYFGTKKINGEISRRKSQ